jgi:hypothetical protein
LVEPTQTRGGILDYVYRVLENNLLCRVIELLS